MRRLVCVSLALLTISGCATAENYEKILASWVGSSEGALINSWGPPDSAYESSGAKYLTYRKSSSGYIPGTQPTYQTQIIGGTAYTTSYGGSPGYSYNRNCKTTFTVSDGTISSWRYEGNACVAHAPK